MVFDMMYDIHKSLVPATDMMKPWELIIISAIIAKIVLYSQRQVDKRFPAEW